jgi:hypothetical protein
LKQIIHEGQRFLLREMVGFRHNDPVHRAAANDFPFQNRATRGSVCNGLFAASSFTTEAQTSFHFNDSTFWPEQVEPRLELWTLPRRQQTINECKKSLSCPMAIERCQSIRRSPKEQPDTVGSQAGRTFPVFDRLAVDHGYSSGRLAMLLQLPKRTKQRIATAVAPNAKSLFLLLLAND